MKHLLPHLLFFALSGSVFSARASIYERISVQVINGDTVTLAELKPFFVFNKPIDFNELDWTIYNLKVVYPIAKDANRVLHQMESHLLTIRSKKEQTAYIKSVEKELKEQYTPIIKGLTYNQGKILIKLIDRETQHSAYDLVKQLRNGFNAFLWQSAARLFGANLKDEYDPAGEDAILEYLIQLYEAGEI